MGTELELLRPLANVTCRCWTCGGVGGYAYGRFNRLWECTGCEAIRHLDDSAGNAAGRAARTEQMVLW